MDLDFLELDVATSKRAIIKVFKMPVLEMEGKRGLVKLRFEKTFG